jgi:hypothetical protein
MTKQMSDSTKEKDSDEVSKSTTGSESLRNVKRRRSNRAAIVLVVAVFALAATAIIAWMFLRSGSGGAGRPVPAPRSISAEQRRK